jgi:hypothetical protein
MLTTIAKILPGNVWIWMTDRGKREIPGATFLILVWGIILFLSIRSKDPK